MSVASILFFVNVYKWMSCHQCRWPAVSVLIAITAVTAVTAVTATDTPLHHGHVTPPGREEPGSIGGE